MKDPDEVEEFKIYNIADLIKGLKLAFPDANYFALNPNLTTLNEGIWENEWYAVGFREKPVLKEISGYPAWVENEDVTDAVDESSIFFLHFNSLGWFFEDWILQESKTDFQSPENLCFAIIGGEVVQTK